MFFTVLCWFCHTAMQINHNYTCIPSLLNLPPLSPPHSWSLSQECQTAPSATWQLLTSYTSYTWESIYVDVNFSSRPTLSALLYPQVHSLYLHLSSFLADKFINGVILDYLSLSLSIYIYIYILIYYFVFISVISQTALLFSIIDKSVCGEVK